MKNMIKMNDIIAFIEKAMENNLNIRTEIREGLGEHSIVVNKSNGDYITISYMDSNPNFLKIFTPWNFVEIEVNEMDLALYKVTILKAREYSINKGIEYFNNFIDEKYSGPTTINDLDDEND